MSAPVQQRLVIAAVALVCWAGVAAESAQAVATCPTSAAYARAVAQNTGLVGYWRLGDSSGTVACDGKGLNQGTYRGGFTLARSGALAGDTDTAASFNGTNGDVSIPNATSLNVADTFTIEAWVKRGATGGTAGQVIASKQTNAWMLLFNSANKLVLQQAGGSAIVASTTAITDTTSWHHVVAAKSGTTVKLYIDGRDVTGTVTNKTLVNNTSALLIGDNASSAYMNGTVDEIAVYKTALDANTVLNHYLLALAGCSSASSAYAQSVAQTGTLVSFWRLGERSGSTACDLAGRNPGAFQGGFTLGVPGALNGDSDTATTLNGTTGWISVPPLASLNTGDLFTIEAWVKRGSTGGTSNQVIASKQGSSWTLMFNTSNQLVLQSNTTKIVASTSPISDTTTWHQVAATKAGATVKLYIDGRDVTGTITNVPLANSTSALAIGQTGASGSWFKGSVDDVALYGSALTAAAIGSHYTLGAAPANTAVPTITGTAATGNTLTATNGTWVAATSYTYRWQSCDANGANCADIAGATAQTYTIATTDADHKLRVVVTGSNSAGSTAANSAVTAKVQGPPPINTAPPTIAGNTFSGDQLTAGAGSWDGSPTFTYQWQRCDGGGNSCVDVAGATSATYTLVDADIDQTVRVVVTASNSAGPTTATSHQTYAIIATEPTITAAPTVTGSPAQGHTLTATPGTWSGSPTAFTYQWVLCDQDGENCSDIEGATAAAHVVDGIEVDATLRVLVTALGTHGSSGIAASQQTAVVTADDAAPQMTDAPQVYGDFVDGGVASAYDGQWSDPNASLSRQWQVCDSTGAACEPIISATGNDLQLDDSDVGRTIRVVVTATSGALTTSVPSSQSEVVAGIAPSNTELPVVFGTPSIGQELTAGRGNWAGSALSYSYAWQRCDSSGASCSGIADAAESNYTLTSTDLAQTLRVVVTARNDQGSAAATSEAFSVPQSANALPTAPRLKAPATSSDPYRLDPATLDGLDPGLFSYQWQRCMSGTCRGIPDEAAPIYAPTAADQGATLRLRISRGPGNSVYTPESDLVGGARMAARAATTTSAATDSSETLWLLGAAPDTYGKGLWSAKSDGTHLRSVYPCIDGNVCADSDLAVSPGGNRVAIPTFGNPNGIATVTADGVHDSQPVNDYADGLHGWWTEYFTPSFSPDGGRILFTRYYSPPCCTAPQEFSLYAVSLTSPGPPRKILTSSPNNSSDGAWDSDGSRLVYRDNNADSLYIARGDGSAYHALAGTSAFPFHPRFSPDGERIVYSAYTGVRGASTTAVYTINVDGTNKQRVSPLSQDAEDAYWAPDGRSVFYSVPRYCPSGGGGTAKAIAGSYSPFPSATAMGTRGRETSTAHEYARTHQTPASAAKSAAAAAQLCTPDADIGIWTVGDGGENPHKLITSYPDGFTGGDAAPRFREASDVSEDDIQAAQFRPVLKFDSRERWRPLNVEQMIAEKRPPQENGNLPYNIIGDDSGINPAGQPGAPPEQSWQDLRSFAGSGAQIVLGHDPVNESLFDVKPHHYKSPYGLCRSHPADSDVDIFDCNGSEPGADRTGRDARALTAIYYNAEHTWANDPFLASHGRSYIDYWFFYRFNEFPTDNHVGDWEGITVGAAPGTVGFDYVSFFQHGYQTNYMHGDLKCGRQGTTCQDADTRVWVYSALGSHASYPEQADCRNGGSLYSFFGKCRQSGAGAGGVEHTLPEGNHNGIVDWGQNWKDPFTSQALLRFPGQIGTWNDPVFGNRFASWADWPGKWGGISSPGRGGNRTKFICPWHDDPNESAPCPQKVAVSATSRAAFLDVSSRTCGNWFGDYVVALACSPSELKATLDKNRLRKQSRTRLVLNMKGRRSDAAAGLSQAVGRPLAVGESVALAGRTPPDTTMTFRAEFRGKLYTGAFDNVRTAKHRPAVVSVVRRGHGVQFVLRDASARSQRLTGVAQRNEAGSGLHRSGTHR